MRTNHREIEPPSWEELRSAFSFQGILPKKKDAGCQSFTKIRLGMHIAEYYRKRRGGGGEITHVLQLVEALMGKGMLTPQDPGRALTRLATSPFTFPALLFRQAQPARRSPWVLAKELSLLTPPQHAAEGLAALAVR